MRYKQDRREGWGKCESEQLLNQISSAQLRLYDKLVNLEMATLDISEYNRHYLASKLSSAKATLQLYGRLLFLSLRDRQVRPEDFVMVDYGGGSGLLSFLAAEMGVGTVVYNDVYDVSCADVRHLSRSFGLSLDHIVCGDVECLLAYLQEKALSIDAITSSDVIEHIYDVEGHLRSLRILPNRGLRVVYASGANGENPFYVRSVKKKQAEVEYRDRQREPGHKDRDSLRSYLDIRRGLICSYAPDMSFEQVEHLARCTRGLIDRDIETCVDGFRRGGDGGMAYRPDHPTNTCDPTTGNWCEHLVQLGWLEQILESEGFSVEIMTGRYSTCGSLAKRAASVLVNAVIQLLGRRGMLIAPYYVVYANLAGQHVAREADSPAFCPGQ